jgi:hypothetical protein
LHGSQKTLGYASERASARAERARNMNLVPLLVAACSLAAVNCRPDPPVLEDVSPAAGAPATPLTDSTQKAARVGIGQRGVAQHYAMSVSETKECVLEPHFRPSAGLVKLGVLVHIEATGGLQVPANPFYATLLDASQTRYETTLAGCQPALHAGQLTRDQKASGWISFEIPKAARGLQLTYAPLLLGAGKDELTFALDR